MNIFRWDSPFMQKLAMVGNLIVLNVLWLICSLPIVTAGASTAALYYTVFQFQTADETEVLRPFFRAFRRNFKQATLLWLPTLVITALILLDVRYLFAYGGGTILQAGVIVMGVVFLFMQTQLLPIIARFETKSMAAVKNAILLSILHFPSSILMAVLNILPLVVFLLFTVPFMQWLPLWAGLYFSLVAYLNGRMLLKIWKKHMPEEETESAPE